MKQTCTLAYLISHARGNAHFYREAQKNAFIASCQQRLGSRTAAPSYVWQHTPTRQRASSFTPTGNSYARYQDSIQTPVLQQHNSQPFFDQFSYGSPQFSTTGGTLDGGSVNGGGQTLSTKVSLICIQASHQQLLAPTRTMPPMALHRLADTLCSKRQVLGRNGSDNSHTFFGLITCQ